MYSITFRTKRGGTGVIITRNYDELLKNVRRLFKNRQEATIYLNGEIIGRVFEDDTQRLGWNFYIDKEAQP